MIVLTEQVFVEEIECTRVLQFDTVEELIKYCEYINTQADD